MKNTPHRFPLATWHTTTTLHFCTFPTTHRTQSGMNASIHVVGSAPGLSPPSDFSKSVHFSRGSWVFTSRLRFIRSLYIPCCFYPHCECSMSGLTCHRLKEEIAVVACISTSPSWLSRQPHGCAPFFRLTPSKTKEQSGK